MSRTAWLQSYSGVRAQVGLGPRVTQEDEVFAFRHAYCYAMSRLQVNPAPSARLVLARDPRPTGGALAAAQARGLATACHDLGVTLDLIDLGIVPTPVWQHSVRLFEAHGGVMITASHNPLDENGWKYATGIATFGVDPAPAGALLSAAEMGNLIRAANAFAPQPWSPPDDDRGGRRRGRRSLTSSMPDATARERAVSNYVRFLADTYFAHAPGVRVVLDPNGGAACAVAERAFRALGVEPIVINGIEGQVAHEIDVEHPRPDGTHVLDDVAERVRAERAMFGLAYDFDADRGNLAYVDSTGRTHIPSPQAVAAINTAIALAVHRRSGDPRRPAVVASDATSCRVKQVAAAFGAAYFEVETGEINVVTKMQDLEEHDLCAVVGLEGPNGGTVFAGTTCRDGTLVGAGALLAAADAELRAIVSETLAPGRPVGPDLAGFVDLLPLQRSFAEKHAAPADWKQTVVTFDREFPRLFASDLARSWERFDIVYSYTRYVGPERPSAGGYGWKARVFRHDAEGFLWIRGSKTEAGVARIVADAPNEAAARVLMDIGRRLLSAGG
jgi:phosphomannomutase